MGELTTVGTPVIRSDAWEKASGSATYCDDIKLPGMLFGALLYSPCAHANIRHIDTSQAEALPGVHAVVTGKDYPFRYGSVIKDRPVFAMDKVRFSGEVVAAVAAEDEETALAACK